MRKLLKRIIQFKLKWLAKFYLLRQEPAVIMVSGTPGRFWAKEAVVSALAGKEMPVIESVKNFNAEIGLPLSILELPSGEGDFRKWVKILLAGAGKIIDAYRHRTKPMKYFVLEAAIDRPDDMDYLLSIARPRAVVLTALNMIYQENFENLDAIAREYKKLIEALPWDGLPVLNFDDQRILKLAQSFKGRSVTYGLGEGADYRAIEVKKVSDGQEFKIQINHPNREPEIIAVKINRFGRHHVYARLIEEIIKEKFKSVSKDFFGKIAME